MPTYVYKFVDTGETIEVQQAFTDNALTEAEHPTTGQLRPVKKVFTPVGVSFKGGGFYKTDSRSGSRSSTKTKSGDGASGDGASSSGSSDGGSKSDSTATTASSDSSSSSSKASASSSSSPSSTSSD